MTTKRIIIINEFARALDGRIKKIPVHALRTGDVLSGSGETVRRQRAVDHRTEVELAKGGYRRIVTWASQAKIAVVARDGVGTPEEIAYGEGWHSSENVNPYTSATEKAAWEKGRAAKKQKMKLNSNARAGEVRGRSFQPPKQRIADEDDVARRPHWTNMYLDDWKRKAENYGHKITRTQPQGRHNGNMYTATDPEGNIWGKFDDFTQSGYYNKPKPSRDFKSEKGYVAQLVDIKTGNVLAKSEPHISNGPKLQDWLKAKTKELVNKGKRGFRPETIMVFYDPERA